MILDQLGRGGPLTFNDTDARALCQKPSGTVLLSDFYGKPADGNPALDFEYTVPGTYSLPIPAGITKAAIALRGGSGGGGSGGGAGEYDWTNGTAGGGGGAGGKGQTIYRVIDVTPGSTLTIIVGAGGAGGASVSWYEVPSGDGTGRHGSNGNPGADGGATSIVGIASADGGRGGAGGTGGEQDKKAAESPGGLGGAGYPAGESGKWAHMWESYTGGAYLLGKVETAPYLISQYGMYDLATNQYYTGENIAPGAGGASDGFGGAGGSGGYWADPTWTSLATRYNYPQIWWTFARWEGDSESAWGSAGSKGADGYARVLLLSTTLLGTDGPALSNATASPKPPYIVRTEIPAQYYPPDNTCFPAGSQVLMGDGTWSNIETIKVGDMVMGVNGPTPVVDYHMPILGGRRMLNFVGTDMFWSEEHAMWTKRDDTQWWWSANPEKWKAEAEEGVIGGLFDNDSIRSGVENTKWANLIGWTSQEIVQVSAAQDTQLYLPLTSGSPIIVNGYVVGAGVNQYGFDYTTLDWDAVRPEIVKAIK
jgi:hypothetical protein